MTKLHHLHAAPAKGTKSRKPVSFDIGHNIRVRLDGGTEEQKTETVQRLATLWNMHDGIPTHVLESGVVRDFYDAVQKLLDVMKEPADAFLSSADPVAYRQEEITAMHEVVKAWGAITVELTAEGRRAECPCSEKVRETTTTEADA